ncbi:MAG TPA: S8 family serine peptidase [Hyphomicrobiales bacterium]|nr:S8 family serine peptidase [Hyphomicrobiales bacterium]
MLTKAMADDDKGESRSSSGRSESRSSEHGESKSSERSRESSSEHQEREDSRESEHHENDDHDDHDDNDDNHDNDDNDDHDDNDDNDDDFDLKDGLAELFGRLTEPSKYKLRSQRSRRNFHTPRARNEILAVNLGRADAKNARKLGFKIRGSSQFSHLRGNVTRLVPPVNLNAREARDLLSRAQPNSTFSINQHYGFYQPARVDESEQHGNTEPARHGPGTACAATKCFGRQIIHWRNEIQNCARGLRVGIIDTQVDHQHPTFSKAEIHLGGFLPDGVESAPAWHGTGVLSVLAGDQESGTPGLIPQAAFYTASVFFQDKEDGVETDTVSILNALEWMSAFDVKVINMSFSGPKDDLLEETIRQMSQEGVIFVAAAGNDGPTAEPSYPASYPEVIAVTAVGRDLRNYPYANRGDSLDASAPGVDIWSAVPDGREGAHTGTSFAAPHVTAMLATVYQSAKRAQNKEELFNHLKMIDLGPPGRDPIYGRGLMLAPTNCDDANSGWVAQTTSSMNDKIQLTTRESVPDRSRTTPSGGYSYR